MTTKSRREYLAEEQSSKRPRFRITIISIILANLIPLVGVLLWGWSPFEVIIIYVVETAIVGVFNVLKMLIARRRGSPSYLKFIFVPFFIIHYGLFVAIQGVFILIVIPVILNQGNLEESIESGQWLTNSDLLGNFLWTCLILFGSHLFSFIWNFIYKGEYQKTDASELMMKPYGRIFAQQFIAIFGTFLAILTGNEMLVMILVILIKTTVDVLSHIREHEDLQNG